MSGSIVRRCTYAWRKREQRNPNCIAGLATHRASNVAAWTGGGVFAVDGGYTVG
ncbi:MAG: hypothetical protein J0J15_12875 [Mesorhizobium sp.]|nr:hypothetical protein [Mesorhizobium sp.]